MNKEKLDSIETILAHQERQIQDLSDIINLHRKEIDVLKARLDKTQNKIVELESGGASGPDQGLSPTEQAARDKPPHY